MSKRKPSREQVELGPNLRVDLPDPEFPPPPKGANAEFERIVTEAWAALIDKGNPENVTEEVFRNTVAHAFGVKAGVKFEADR